MDRPRGLNVGIFFNARRAKGGLYQYAVALVHCLYRHERKHSYTLFLGGGDPVPFPVDDPRWRVVELPRRERFLRLGLEAVLLTAARFGWRRRVPLVPLYPAFRGVPIDLMLYVKNTVHAAVWPYPAVFPIHDLQHVLQPEFAEVSAFGERARREYINRNAVPRAAAVLTDSDVGREDVIRTYGADPARVYALPYLASPYLGADVREEDLERVRRRYALPDAFLFYPSVFWPHKNHARLIQALAILRDHHDQRIALALTGGRSREYGRLAALAAGLGLGDQVRFLGPVPDEDMVPLYRLARALVMPTFFGPTNIPVLEAWAQGCPVVTSDIRGIREQVGDAGLLVDPRDAGAIAAAVLRLCADASLRRTLAGRGRAKAAAWTPADWAGRLGTILEEAGRRMMRRSRWPTGSRTASDLIDPAF